MSSSLFGKPTSGAAEIDHAEFVALQRDGAASIVDVREPHEFVAGHIPGAVNLPLSRFDPSELPVGKPVVLVCQAGARSLKALQRARAEGVENVRHYAPGTGGWRAQGEPVDIGE